MVLHFRASIGRPPTGRPRSNGLMWRCADIPMPGRATQWPATTDRYAPSMVPGVSGQPLPRAARTSQTDARWLALRVEADNAARALTAGTLLPRLVQYLATRGAADSGVEVIDLGAGTGANQRWLTPRLPFRQHWLLIDHDQAFLHHQRVTPRTRLLTADVGIL